MRKYFLHTLGLFLVLITLVGFSFLSVPKAQAVPVAVVADAPRTVSNVLEAVKEAFIKVGRVTFLNSLRSLVNQFAYDTATYLGSGGSGQKPVYFTQEFGPWLRDQAFNVGGQFIEEFAQTEEGEFIDKYNICSPNLAVNIKIALGLTDFASQSRGLSQSRCNLKKIYESGAEQVDLFRNQDYLKNLAITAFDPSTTDVGAAFTLFNQIGLEVAQKKEDSELQRLEDRGWIDIRNLISGERKSPPGENERRLTQAQDLQTQNFFTQTGDIFVDAANIFLNQLALSAFNKLVDNLSGKNNSSSSSASNYYSQGNTGGITEVARQNSTILQARFNERADYDILSQLTACKDESTPGPTECVIDKQFAQAIEQQLTISEAVERGLLNGKMRVGYKTSGDAMSYTEGYPYRSLIILRKYRVLPVGWEVAAQYIQSHSQETKDVTLLDLMNCFSTTDTSYQGLAAEWCRGLIDPYWVLKLPKLYCGMEGYGPQILGSTVYDATLDGITHDYRISLTRNGGYCADEQSCILQNANGTCAQYGYCTEEKRTWTFSQSQNSTCEPRNNTCQTFKNDNGQQASFLENTLDYSDCDANQVGCKQYALEGPYDQATKKIAWSPTGKQAYFNKNATECDPTRENCHEFIRIKDGLDTNLIADGSFELSTCISSGVISQNNNEDSKKTGLFNSLIPTAYAQLLDGTCELESFNASQVNNLAAPNNRWYILRNGTTAVKAGITNTHADTGSQSLYIEGDGGFFSQEAGGSGSRYSILPDTFVMEDNHYYTFSARVYVTEGRAYAGIGYSGTNHIDSTVLNQWQTLRITYYKPVGGTETNYFVMGRTPNTKFYLDSVKLTVGRALTDYSEYGQNNVIYEKLLPNYLAATCYETGLREPYTPKANAPAECQQFARQCNDSEVGCEAFKSLDTGLSITGKVKASDYCPQSCVGYNTFVQQPNAFNPRQAAYFIPSTARRCSAAAVGCTAFTNLDKLDQGGEAIEYYSAMRRCIKPDPNACLPFYTWEGSDESGYQLKVFSLQKDTGSRLGDEPLSTMPTAEEALICNEAVFRKLPTEPGYNYDCRQFYAQDGTVSYHLLEKTISCSDDCHPYRRELSTAASCAAGGGSWDATQNRCLYYAIPGEGKQCAAADAGCSEYTGNIASNTRNIFVPAISTFEDNNNPLEGWSSSLGVSRSNASLNLGGHSLRASTLQKQLGNTVTQNSSYNLTFLARSTTGTTVPVTSIEFKNKDGASAAFSTSGTTVGTEWRLYSFNLGTLDHQVDEEIISLTFGSEIFIDNIKLTEIPNRYYLVKNSWTTPAECDQDFSGASASGYMLGCSQYERTDRTRVNLKSFSDLCSDSSAGCEAMIDTHNSTDYRRKLTNDTNGNGTCDSTERGCIETPADTMINVIHDTSKYCGAENKGCQRVGRGSTYDGSTTFTDAYILNDPDRYTTTVCKENAVGCSKWTSPDGDAYFKDPGNEVCEWRLVTSLSNQYKWYKKDIKRCNGGGAICTSDGDCSSGQTCQDVLCDVSSDKTVGLGGKGNVVYQPSVWAGLCEASQASCTEYIDPLSKFNENLIINPGYRQTDPLSSTVEGWTRIGTSNEAIQPISLTPQTLYILKGSLPRDRVAPRMDIKLNCPTINVLDDSNTFVTQSVIDYNTDPYSSAQFYIPITDLSDPYRPVSCTLTLRRTPLIINPGDMVYLRKAIINYQFRTTVDKTSHNNLVNFGKGAVLFNERTQNGTDKASLVYNADRTYENKLDGDSPQTSGNHNANVLLQVRPDRTCAKWLDCLSYIPDPNNPNNKICLDIGECEAFAADGSCASRVSSERINRSQENTLFSNLSGYSKIGYRDTTFNALTDYYNITSMAQVGEKIDIVNPSFEDDDGAGAGSGWDFSTSSIISNPSQIVDKQLNPLQKISSQQRDVRYLVPDGVNMVEILAGGEVKTAPPTDPLEFEVGKRYVLSLYTYGKGGKLTIGLLRPGSSTLETLLEIQGSDKPQQWVKRTIGFKAAAPEYYLVFKSEDNDSYIDDIKIESGLNVRCSDPDADPLDCISPTINPSDPQPQYVGSTCRLYPTENSLSCLHVDENNVTSQGVKGYCLENDPRNPSVCLLWYPVDRIASDPMEEGGGVSFNGDVYYCLDARDECKAAPENETPQLYCRDFVKVDTSQYWAGRLAENSSLKLPDTVFPESPFFYPSATRKIDFGGKAGPSITLPPLPRTLTENYYGAKLGNLSGKQLVTNSGGNINSFMPYFGSVSQAKCSALNPPPGIYPGSPVDDTQFFGHELGSGNSMVFNLGEWDVCAVTFARDVDFSSCGSNCKYRNITGSDFFEFRDCSNGGAYDQLVCDSGYSALCTISRVGNSNFWQLDVRDDNSDSDDPSCTTYCYNRIKEVKVTQSVGIGASKAMEVIKRLFPRTSAWQIYRWNGSSYTPPTISPGLPPAITTLCPASGRPAIDGATDADYCYIYPIIFDYKIDGKTASQGPIIVNGRQYITFSYSTKTDIEQRPLKEITVDLGYDLPDGSRAVYSPSGGNFADLNPRYYTTLYDYDQISAGGNTTLYRGTPAECNGAASCYYVTPKIHIKDNWNKYDDLESSEEITIIVKKPS